MKDRKIETEHVIRTVYPGSIAEEMELQPGDVLTRINGTRIRDVFDYRYMIKNDFIEVQVRKADGGEWVLEIEKDYDEDLGLEFENSLMSEYRSCSNGCIFCFIDQMPPGMRETLYFKDDDSRLSFLQGNYITLTNMGDEEIERIIYMHLAPINISVHTTNPELRCKMLRNRFAGEKLRYLQELYDHHIEMNGQVVCCRGVNDGAELERTMDDLARYLPFMRSVSIVPAGLTKFREGLYPLELFTREEAGQVIDAVERRQEEYYREYGLHFVHASDEWYFLADREFPEESRYDGYIQLENGVGMMRLFMTEFEAALREEQERPDYSRRKQTLSRSLTIATGMLAYSSFCDFARQLEAVYPGIKLQVCGIRNEFFGETITVSGLVTGQDLTGQLQQMAREGKELGDAVLIPENMLRMGEQVFLDDLTVQEAGKTLGVPVVPVDASGYSFVQAVLDPGYRMERDNENFVYIQAYDRSEQTSDEGGKE